MTPAIVKCYVDDSSDYPTHRPLVIEVLTRMLEVTVKELQQTANFARLFNQRVEEEAEKAAMKKEEETQKGNDKFEGEQEFTIRKRTWKSSTT